MSSRSDRNGIRKQNEVLCFLMQCKRFAFGCLALIVLVLIPVSSGVAQTGNLGDPILGPSAGSRALAGAGFADPGEIGNVAGSTAILALEPRYDTAAQATLFAGGGFGYTLSAVDSETALYTMGAMYRSSRSELVLDTSDSTGWEQVGDETVNMADTRVISSGFSIGFAEDRAAVGLSVLQWKRTATESGSGSGWRFTGGLSAALHERVLVGVDASVPAFDEGARGLEGEALIEAGLRYQPFELTTLFVASLTPISGVTTAMAGAEVGPDERLALRFGACREVTLDTATTSFGLGLHSDGELVGFDVSTSVLPEGDAWAWTWSAAARLRF